MDSEEFKEATVPTYATEAERMRAMHEFQLEQAEISRRHNEEDAK